MRAKDIMTYPVHIVRQNASVESAAHLMTAHAVTALPVVDLEGLLVGMVSESDLLWHRVPSDATADALPHLDSDPSHRPGMVAEVMSAYPVVTAAEADVADVAEAMLEYDVRSMPVLDGCRIVGVISRRDILRAMVRSDATLVREVQHRLDDFGDGEPRWTATVEKGVAAVSGHYHNETERAIVEVLARTVPGVSAVELMALSGS